MKLIVGMLISGLIYTSCRDDEYCAKCAGENQCSFCWQAYLVNGVCTKITMPVDHCLSYAVDGFCKQCREGYFFNIAGRCYKQADDGCAIYNYLGDCKYCKDGVRVNNGVCDKDILCSDRYCKYCNSLDFCDQCQQGTYLDADGRCVVTAESKVLTSNGSKIVDMCEVRTHSGCMMCMYGSHDRDGDCWSSSAYNKTMGALIFEWTAILVNILLFL